MEILIIIYSLCGTPQYITTVQGDKITTYEATPRVARILSTRHPNSKVASIALENTNKDKHCA